MSLSSSIPAYLITVREASLLSPPERTATILPAEAADMPDIWSCQWSILWEQVYEPTEAIVKLTHNGELLGLVKFALYPSRTNPSQMEFTEIMNIETLPKQGRTFNPVASWLIWYVCLIAIERCQGNNLGQILTLVSVESAIEYYQDRVKMEGLGWITIAPNEDGYAFAFSKTAAKQFCTRIESRYGTPKLL